MTPDLTTIAYFSGETLDNAVAELNEYQGAPTRRLKVKLPAQIVAAHPHLPELIGKHLWIQACTDTEGGGDGNDSTQCPGGILC